MHRSGEHLSRGKQRATADPPSQRTTAELGQGIPLPFFMSFCMPFWHCPLT